MVKLFSKNSNLCDHNSPTLQTDRQTTCDRNTALCTKVHRAVKMTFFHKCVHIGPNVLLRWVTAGNGSVPYGLVKQAIGRGRSLAPYSGLCVGHKCRSLIFAAWHCCVYQRQHRPIIGNIGLYCLWSQPSSIRCTSYIIIRWCLTTIGL